MGYSINNDCRVSLPSAKKIKQSPSREEVRNLARMYEDSLMRAEAETKIWNKLQYEGSLAIAQQAKNGQISDKAAQLRELTNDAIAHRAYQRIASQSEQDLHRYNLLKSEYPEILSSN